MTFDDLQKGLYEDLNGRITAVRLVDEAHHVDFGCNHWSERRRVSATISCRGVVESTVTVGSVGFIKQDDNHPLLWQYSEPHDSLFFSSPVENPFDLLGRLYEVHHRLFEGHRLPVRYFQTRADLLRSNSGILADGPRSAIAAYHEIAAPFTRCNVVRNARRTEHYHLIFFDGDYIICRDFTFLERA